MTVPQQQQHDKINTIAEQVKYVKKNMWLMPILGTLGSLVVGAFGLGWMLNKYDISLVKKPEFNVHISTENRYHYNDSIKNAYRDRQIDTLKNTKTGFVTVSYPHGRNGNPQVNPVN